MSTIKANTVTASTTNGDMLLEGNGSGVANIGDAGFKVAGTAGVPMAALRTTSGTASSSTFLRGDGQWQAAGGGAWTYISSATSTSSTSIEFTSDIDSTYEIYMFQLDNFDFTVANTSFNAQVSTDGGSSYLTGTDYFWNCSEVASYTASWNATSTSSGNTAQWRIMNFLDADSAAGIVGLFYLGSPAGTASQVRFWMNGTGVREGDSAIIGLSFGTYDKATILDVNAIRFICFNPGSTTQDAFAGTIRMYGLNKS